MPFHLKPGRGKCADCKIRYNLRWLVTLDRKKRCWPSCGENALRLRRMEGETWEPVKEKTPLSLLPNPVAQKDWTG